MFAAVSQSLAGLAFLLIAIALWLLATLAAPGSRARLAEAAAGQERVLLGLAGLVAVTAMAGSLFYSEVMHFPPCRLCWVQRFAMYPLVPVLGVAAALGGWRVWRLAVPVAGVGLVVSTYHVVIQNMPQLDVVTCSLDNPCTGRFVAVYGFVSIPFMAGAAFLGIVALTLAARVAGRAGEADAGAADADAGAADA